MTILESYVAFGLPLIAIAIGFGALWMVNNDPTRNGGQAKRDARRAPSA